MVLMRLDLQEFIKYEAIQIGKRLRHRWAYEFYVEMEFHNGINYTKLFSLGFLVGPSRLHQEKQDLVILDNYVLL